MRFRNRAEAGQQLGARLMKYAGRTNVIVLGLPRGGIPVAFEIARRLGAPLDVFLVRKLGVPGHPELAMGAIAEGGIAVLSRSLIRDLQVPPALVEHVAVRERLELERRDVLYRDGRIRRDVRNQIAILVDDGLATGSSMQAAIVALRQQKPARIVVAVPVTARDARERVAPMVDEVVCVSMPAPFRAVGLWYEDFSQTTDPQVKGLLAAASNDGRKKPFRNVDDHFDETGEVAETLPTGR
jgi:putative phosphoribosyl transferase